MATQVFDEVFDQDGNVISRTPRSRPERAVSDVAFAQAKSVMRNMLQTYYPGGTPTGNISQNPNDIRNWLIALTIGERYLYGAMDDEA